MLDLNQGRDFSLLTRGFPQWAFFDTGSHSVVLGVYPYRFGSLDKIINRLKRGQIRIFCIDITVLLRKEKSRSILSMLS